MLSSQAGKQYRLPRLLRRLDVLAFLGCVTLYLTFPRIDLLVSAAFHNGQTGFFLKNHPLVVFIYKGTEILMSIMLAGEILLLAASFIPRLRSRLPSRKALLFLISAALTGPGLLVNTGFKEHWQRPRPVQTIEFGGQYAFSPALTPGQECSRCRSFVSGHASVGFYLFAFVLLSRRKRWLWLPILAGILIGFTRIAQGGHFLGDVLFSGWVVWFNTYLLYWLFYRQAPFSIAHQALSRSP